MSSPIGLCTHLIGAREFLGFARRCFHRLGESGASWLRDDFHWHRIETRPGHFDFSYPETLVELADSKGLQVLGILGYSNRNLRNGVLAEQRRQGRYDEWLKRFTEYAVRTIERFKGRVQYWEIWNEPNTTVFWPPEPSAEEYARMLKEIYPLAKQVDPKVVMVAGATLGADCAFLRALYGHGAKGFFDAFSCHPYYFYPINTVNGWHLPETAIADLQSELGAHGDGDKAIWVSEIGFPSVSSRGGEAQQAVQLEKSMGRLLAMPGLGPVFWYDFKDDGPRPEPEHRFGIVREDLSLKPAFFAFQNVVEERGAQAKACRAYNHRGEPLDPAMVRVHYRHGQLLLDPPGVSVWNYPLTAIGGMEGKAPQDIALKLFQELPEELDSWCFRGLQ